MNKKRMIAVRFPYGTLLTATTMVVATLALLAGCGSGGGNQIFSGRSTTSSSSSSSIPGGNSLTPTPTPTPGPTPNTNATRLAFTVQPANGNINTALASVQVTVEDAQGNAVSGAANTVTVTLGNAGGALLGGTFSVAATNGVATFSTLLVDLPGNGYTLSAAASGLTDATSNSFNINQNPEMLYATNAGTSNVTAFTVNANGSLTHLNEFPCGSTPFGIAEDPFRRFVFTANNAGASVTALSVVPTTGALVPVGDFKTPLGSAPFGITTDPSGKFVLVADSGTAQVSVFTVNQFTGSLSNRQDFPTVVTATPELLSINPAGTVVAVPNFTTGNVTTFTFDSATGVLTHVGEFNDAVAGSNPAGSVFSTDGSHVYVTDAAKDEVAAFDCDAGGNLSGADVQSTGIAGGGPFGIAVTPNGNFAIAASQNFEAGFGNLSVFTLTAGEPQAGPQLFTTVAGGSLQGVTVDPTGGFVYAVNQNTALSTVTAFSISGTGGLTKINDFQTTPNGNPRFAAVK